MISANNYIFSICYIRVHVKMIWFPLYFGLVLGFLAHWLGWRRFEIQIKIRLFVNSNLILTPYEYLSFYNFLLCLIGKLLHFHLKYLWKYYCLFPISLTQILLIINLDLTIKHNGCIYIFESVSGSVLVQVTYKFLY